MRRLVLCLLAAMAFVPAAFAADVCTVRVTTAHARGDGLRLKADAQTPGLYTAVVPTNEAFAATVLADAGYTLYREESLPGEAETVLPEGVRFDAVFGRLEIPAAVLAAHAADGIDLSVVAKPITYTIRYHAHGDGEPALAAGASLEGVVGDARSWTQAVDAAEGGGKVVLATTGSLHVAGWTFLGWSRVQGHTVPDYEPGASVDHLTIKHLAQVKLYAVWKTTPEEGKVSYPVVLQNGGFESPVISTYYKHFAGAVIGESAIKDPNAIGWSTTASDNMVEIGRLTGGAAAQYGLSGVREGQQFAELNANTAGLLYQRIATLPHTTLYWGFSHRARGSVGIEKETMSMWIGSAEQIEKAREIYDRFANTKAGDANHLSAEEARAKIAALAEDLQFTNIVHTAARNTDDKSAWEDIQGVFVVPSERPVTEYAFASWVVSTNGNASSYGNLLDRVYLSDSIPLERYDLTVTASPGCVVYVNDSTQLTEVEGGGQYLKSYDKGTLMLLTLATSSEYTFTGITTNGVFVARQNCDAVFLDLMRNGLRENLAIDFVAAADAQVTFRPNGGVYADASVRLSYTRPSCTLLEPVRQGYVFLGWRDLDRGLHAVGSSVVYEVNEQTGNTDLVVYKPDGVTESYRVSSTKGLTLYAQWELDENAESERARYLVELIADDVEGDGAIMKPVVGSPGVYQGQALEGDDFITTLFAADGFRLPSTIEVKNEAGDLLEGWTYNSSTGVIVVPARLVVGKLIVFARGERIRYTIVYSSGGVGEIVGDGVEQVPDKNNVWRQHVVAAGDKVKLADRGTLEAKGWTFLGWARDPAATEAEFVAGASVPHLTRLDLATVKLYGIWDGTGVSSFPVSLHNGSFEQPCNALQDSPKFYIFYPEGAKGLDWLTTASDDKIEIGSVGTKDFQSSSSSSSNYHTALARDGVQFAELNANQVGALYQDVSIVPGVTLYWGFSHKAREEGDALAFLVGSTNEFEQALAIYTANVAAKPEGWQQATLDAIAKAGLSSIQVTYHKAPYDASDLYGWTDLTGKYTVPEGQNVTKFAFLSLSTHKEDSKGNLIDQVYFTTSEPIQTAALRVIATAGGSARVNDGGAEVRKVVLGQPYYSVVGIGSRVVISPVAEEGCSFLGLYCDSKFHPFGACDGLLAFDMPPTDRRVTLLFARDRTITFNPEGGSYVDESYRLSTSSPEYTLGTPNRSGYVFKGWRELTSGNVYLAGETVRYEVDAQYDETVRSYLVIGEGEKQFSAESERGLVLTAVYEIEPSAVERKLVTFVDRDYASTSSPQPYKNLFHILLGAGDSLLLKNQSGLQEICKNTTAARPQGHEPTGWTYEPVDGSAPVDFEYVDMVKHELDGETSCMVVRAVTNGVLDTFRFDGVQSMRFVARWDRFYDVVWLEDDSVTTNRTVWVPKSWLDAKGYTAIGEDNYRTAIEENGANGVPLWKSYLFGLDPTNAASAALNRPFHRLAGDRVSLLLDGVKVVKYLNDIYEAKSGSTLYSSWSGRDYRTYKVRFALMGANDRVNGLWTQVGEEQETPEFRLAPGELVYRYYRIEGRVDRPQQPVE